MLERFELADRADALRLELVTIRADLDAILVPALDDQLFLHDDRVSKARSASGVS